ncbi:MAG: YetF domain-containing protein [Marmoricola sp.]
MWNDLMDIGTSVPDKLIRTVAVYVAIAVLLRLAGKRDLAQLNSFDLVVMLLLSNVVQNAVIGPDNSLTGGLLGAAALLALNAVVVRVSRRSDKATAVFEGTPSVLARDGSWDERALRHEGLRLADVNAAVRRQNATGIEDVEKVTLEVGGALVVEMRPDAQPATQADVKRLEAKLDRLLAG